MMKYLLPPSVRRWIRRHDSGYYRLQAEVAELKQQLATSDGHPRATLYGRMSDEDFRRIDQQGLFVVGCARSGTTIFCDCLNTSPDIFLLGEAHLYLNHDFADFAGHFEEQRILWKNRRAKGTYLPPPLTAEPGGLAAVRRMGERFRYVGEKIAFGPHGLVGGRKMPDLWFAFHARFFYYSKYFLIARKPAESIWSMAKMFPDRPLPMLVESWLDTLRIQCDVFDTFPHVYFLCFENFRPEAFDTIQSLLGVDIPIGPAMITDKRKSTRVDERELPPLLEPLRGLLDRCDGLYRDVKDAFCPTTLLLKDTLPRYRAVGLGVLNTFRDRIDELLAEVGPGDGGDAKAT